MWEGSGLYASEGRTRSRSQSPAAARRITFQTPAAKASRGGSGMELRTPGRNLTPGAVGKVPGSLEKTARKIRALQEKCSVSST